MTLRRLRGLFPLCINPTTLSSSFPVPLLDFFPSTAVPTGTNSGQRPSLLAAPENPDYRPVFFKDECQTLAKYPKGWWNSIEFIDDRIINWSQLTILQLLNHCSCGNMSEWFESAGVSISRSRHRFGCASRSIFSASSFTRLPARLWDPNEISR